ncbi:hypothetical protein HF086_004028 [Spodoptera exigua]|uniref:Cathepsin propeptide inhibitor domain-containing protein n=1 Tax=Spodoptera exigua TaxID=7107 RepID=A0A922MAW5_SPOEX|nr:hypothetical protein HF086_004028 [Spodoptera exigua]
MFGGVTRSAAVGQWVGDKERVDLRNRRRVIVVIMTSQKKLPTSSVTMDSNFVFRLKDAPQLYKDFIKRYHRTFESEYDYNQRYMNFIQTLRYINSINAQTFTEQKVLPNQFADYSDDERRNYLRKTAKRIDPELRMILRMNEDPEESKEETVRSQPTERTGYIIRSYA